ncbi:unnamed protein product [Paramecium pentaurelia]|uniref:Uncharacterized protein n=1 Tax=Paramecium pentaurelia TaxID=43138 RepID=A0A8S1VLT6_9CILI|nr:unnamed protein product [Paramecium pentaurelia]
MYQKNIYQGWFNSQQKRRSYLKKQNSKSKIYKKRNSISSGWENDQDVSKIINQVTNINNDQFRTNKVSYLAKLKDSQLLKNKKVDCGLELEFGEFILKMVRNELQGVFIIRMIQNQCKNL